MSQNGVHTFMGVHPLFRVEQRCQILEVNLGSLIPQNKVKKMSAFFNVMFPSASILLTFKSIKIF